MTRLYGWAPKGERLIDKVPHSHWETATFLAALRSDRIDAPCLFDGPINGERFRAYVEQFLVPTLKAGDVVILDNLGSHKGKAMRKAIRDVGARLSGTRPAPARIYKLRGSSFTSRYSIPSGPTPVIWVMYSPDFAQWKCQVSPGRTTTAPGG